MSQAFDEWRAAWAKCGATTDRLHLLARVISETASSLLAAARIQPTEKSSRAMVPSPSNWPALDELQRAVNEFNDAHLIEWQKYEILVGQDKADAQILRASRGT